MDLLVVNKGVVNFGGTDWNWWMGPAASIVCKMWNMLCCERCFSLQQQCGTISRFVISTCLMVRGGYQYGLNLALFLAGAGKFVQHSWKWNLTIHWVEESVRAWCDFLFVLLCVRGQAVHLQTLHQVLKPCPSYTMKHPKGLSTRRFTSVKQCCDDRWHWDSVITAGLWLVQVPRIARSSSLLDSSAQDPRQI